MSSTEYVQVHILIASMMLYLQRDSSQHHVCIQSFQADQRHHAFRRHRKPLQETTLQEDLHTLDALAQSQGSSLEIMSSTKIE